MPRRELPKLPAAAREVLDSALRAQGFEVTRSAVRLPARKQLLALLRDERRVDERGLAARLAYVSGPEANALIAALVREREVVRVERPSGTAFALPSERTLDADTATRLAGDLERALKWVRRAAKSPARARLALLDGDVAELLARLGAGVGALPTAPAPADASAGALLELLTRTAVELAETHGGLASVPTLVRAVGASTAAAHAALLEGHARGRFELQPESSMGRLDADDLALCLPGPGGTRLSWVRPIPMRANP